MCIIASIPRGAKISKSTLETMWQHNSDGAGLAWIEEGKVRVFKTMKLKPFLKKFEEVSKEHVDSDLLVHMRIATHGSVCIDNNHPFNVDTQTVFAHNGILPRQFHPPAKRDISDTRYFNETFLQYVKLAALDDSRFIKHLGEVIGSYNKLVILTANPKLREMSYIVNETSGEWSNGVWYSNDSYLSVSRKMKWGTSNYTNNLSTTTYTPAVTDAGASCDLPVKQDKMEIFEFDIETCDQWNLVPKEMWEDEEFTELVFELMNAYGFDTPQDMMEDFQWHARDGKIRCQFCNASLDINQYWPDCKVTCQNHVEYDGIREDDIFIDGEVIEDDDDSWYDQDITAEEAAIRKLEQGSLFGEGDE